MPAGFGLARLWFGVLLLTLLAFGIASIRRTASKARRSTSASGRASSTAALPGVYVTLLGFGAAVGCLRTAPRHSTSPFGSPPMHPPFAGPELKIRRARHHIRELEVVVGDFIARQPFGLSLWKATNGNKYRVTRREPAPEELPVIIGDAVHNIRSSLDLLVNDLLRITIIGKYAAKFPFCRNESEYTEFEKSSFVNKAPDNVRRMLKELRPWQGKIRAIHELDIMDKHRMILPLFAAVSLKSGALRAFPFQEGGGGSALYIGDDEPVWVEVDSSIEEAELNASFKLIFQMADAKLVQNPEVEVAATLTGFADLVERHIQMFKAHCLGS